MGIQISTDVLTALSAALLDGQNLKLTGGLDRKLYTKTNEVLEAAGGKWNRKLQVHVFDGDAVDAIEPILLTGQYSRTKQDFGQFDSPPDVVARVIELAGELYGKMALEPSVGLGNIALALETQGACVAGIEIDTKRYLRAKELCSFAHGLKNSDFLRAGPQPAFDIVAMNPPFAKQADIEHVLHAAKFLAPGGKLVSVMSAGVLFREEARFRSFREYVGARGGEFEALPDDSFRNSGTAVSSCIVHFSEPRP